MYYMRHVMYKRFECPNMFSNTRACSFMMSTCSTTKCIARASLGCSKTCSEARIFYIWHIIYNIYYVTVFRPNEHVYTIYYIIWLYIQYIIQCEAQLAMFTFVKHKLRPTSTRHPSLLISRVFITWQPNPLVPASFHPSARPRHISKTV